MSIILLSALIVSALASLAAYAGVQAGGLNF